MSDTKLLEKKIPEWFINKEDTKKSCTECNIDLRKDLYIVRETPRAYGLANTNDSKKLIFVPKSILE